MKTTITSNKTAWNKAAIKVIAVAEKNTKQKKSIDFLGADQDIQKVFKTLKSKDSFTGSQGRFFTFYLAGGEMVLLAGTGDIKKFSSENLRKISANIANFLASHKLFKATINFNSFLKAFKDEEKAFTALQEGMSLSRYSFDKYKTEKKEAKKLDITYLVEKKVEANLKNVLKKIANRVESINLCRLFIDEPPKVLNSESYSKKVADDIKTNFKGKNVKVKILNKAALKKEKMELFLAVNRGSAYQPQLVHLTYTPKKVTKKTKHIALVGKGLTYDTGGYSIKTGGHMATMKGDMGGSATVYGAFRSAVLNDSPNKITCILGITDNAISSDSMLPDDIFKSRKGLTVEVLNTDAEGRLVLADCLDYASSQKPDMIIDAATLTGACIVALGTQVCAIFGNKETETQKVLASAKEVDEYMWEMPIIDEWREDMKSPNADLKNIGSAGKAGTATAAAFLEYFVGEGIDWAHLDIAGVSDNQTHLPYCPKTGASGLIIRTLENFLMKQ